MNSKIKFVLDAVWHFAKLVAVLYIVVTVWTAYAESYEAKQTDYEIYNRNCVLNALTVCENHNLEYHDLEYKGFWRNIPHAVCSDNFEKVMFPIVC